MNGSTKAIIDLFESAFQEHDPAFFDGIIAEGCTIENTGPAPDGARYEGREACLKFWTSIAANPHMNFIEEQIDILGDRALIFWPLSRGSGASSSVRGVNIMHVRKGKIVEAKGYIKG